MRVTETRLVPLKSALSAFVGARIVFNTMVRMVYPFLPAFGRGLGVDLGVLSLALTLRSGAGMVGPFLASVADSRGRKSGMLFGLALYVFGAGLIGVWASFPAFVLALVLTILGNFIFVPSMQAYLGDRVPYQRRGLALALTEFSWSLSFILGVPAVGLLLARFGWRAPFLFLGSLGLVALLFLARLLPKDQPPPAGQPGLLANFRTVFASHAALAGLAMGLLLSAGNEVVNLLFGVWMEDSFGLQIAALGAASAVIGISELSGEALVSALVDRIGKPLAIGVGLALNSLAALAIPLFGRSVPAALLCLFLFYLTFEFTIVSTIPMMTEILPDARATLMAAWIAFLSLGRALGAAASSPLYAQGMLYTAITCALLNLFALLALRRTSRRLPAG